MDAYLWTVEMEENWSYNKKGQYVDNGMEFNVTAVNSDRAIAKARRLAGVGKVFKDDDGDEYSLVDVRVIGLTKGQIVHG
jgi:hypothetical protein